MDAARGRLTAEWAAWLGENLAMGAPREDVEAALARAGVAPEVARAEVSAALESPLLTGARRVGQRLRRYEELAELSRELHRLGGAHLGVDRRTRLPAAEFFAEYYVRSRPVVLQGMMEGWPALGWSLAHLRERLQGEEVEVMTGRDANPDYASDHDRHRTRMPFGQYADMVERAGETNDFYMVPRNENWRRDGFASLRRDVRAPEGLIDPSLAPDMMTLLLGPAGTVTPLHHDNMNVLLAQVFGRKRVRLVPPFERSRVYPRQGTFSHVDAERPDAARHPDFLEASVVEVVLAPGELLFIPVGWWHWVRALDVSASVSFHHFRVPHGNTYVGAPG